MEIIIILLLILLNGIFSMSEVALISSKRFKLEAATKRGNANAKKALELANDPTRFLSTVQIGITLIGILTGIFSGKKMTTDLQAALERIDALQPYAHSLAVLCVVIIITFFSIVFGELIPKRVGLLFPETIATFVARPMNVVSMIAAPFIWLLTVTNDIVLRIFGIKDDLEGKVTEEEIKAIVRQGADVGEIEAIEHSIVDRVFALGDRKVSELMTHRTKIAWFDIKDSVDVVRKKVERETHSIYPVADGTLDKFLGVVNVKEMFAADLAAGSFGLDKFVKKPLIVHESTQPYILLEKFRAYRMHHAMIVDEYGSLQGMISMDDILDALVGDVSENMMQEYNIVQRDESSWLIDGQYPYFELLNYFGISHEDGMDTEQSFNTVAGLLLHLAARIPALGEQFEWMEFRIEAVDMDGMRIDKIMLTRVEGKEKNEEE
ncbi:hemolysin family protein [Nemorincola caseinilytica]|uniref:Hemolysin family protein n=1 Tax=Nemorincola caseinilytica TaxID=2054315 RepID=A0ABP8NQZ2_9BACT